MYRVTCLDNNWYALEIEEDCLDDEIEVIHALVRDGTPVILVDDLTDLEDVHVDMANFNITEIEIEIAK